jgi:hypothetical protein
MPPQNIAVAALQVLEVVQHLVARAMAAGKYLLVKKGPLYLATAKAAGKSLLVKKGLLHLETA